MKISLAQIPVKSGNPEHNTQHMVECIKKSGHAQDDLIVFPEMSDTGYDMPTILDKASSWDKEPVKKLQEAAKSNNINVIAGISERDGKQVFNAVAVINREGEITGKYRKTHLITAAPMHEEKFLGFGEELVTVNIDGIKTGLMTCYEIRFPEIARKLAQSGAELIIIPAAFPLIRLSHWQVLTAARAIENQVFVAAISRIGSDSPDSTIFCGTSTVYNPYGTVLATGSSVHEEFVRATMDFDFINTVRQQIKVHQDIRPELYAQDITCY